jgi:ATP-binding cassette subfamily F protein 3
MVVADAGIFKHYSSMIRLSNITKTFGTQDVFDEVSLSLNAGERVGLVGRNGHGKTTLFRIIMGLEEAEQGQVLIPKNYRIGYLTQNLNFTQPSVLGEACLGLPDRHADDTWRVEKVLAGLGFRPADMQRHPAEFSGGFQVRLNLSKALVSVPDLLLLDEPTNYLDVVSIRWLAQYLRQWKGELCLITHDRAFMDGVVTHVAAIHQRKIRKLKGTTSKLYDLMDREGEIYEKTRLNEEKKRRETEQYIARFRSKARLASNVQSKVKALAKQERKQKAVSIKDLNFSFGWSETPAKTLMSVTQLDFGYTPERQLIDDFNLAVGQHDRVCVIGHNGQGKTTLLRLLADDLHPDKGEIHLHPKTIIGYFAQTNIADLNPEWTVEQELMNVGCDKPRARSLAGAMMFEGDAAEKPTAILSGGEKSRVLLGKVLAQASNLLLLDEPTNHLDMQSADAFLDALERFEGAVVMVTHNEMFLHRLANRFVVFQQDRIDYFEGSYQDFLEQVGWADEAERPSTNLSMGGAAAPAEKKTLSKKELRKQRAALVALSSQEVTPLKQRSEALEKEIMDLETVVEDLDQEMIAVSSAGEGKKLGELSKKSQAAKARIDHLFEELEKVSAELDEKSKAIAAQMELLEE